MPRKPPGRRGAHRAVLAQQLSAAPLWKISFLLALVALVPRLVHLAAMWRSPYLQVPLIDAYEHDSVARQIVAGRFLWDQPLFKAPGYVYWLAAVYAVTGGSMIAALLLQMLLGAASCALVFLIGCRTVGRKAGLLAALLLAFYGVAIHHATYLEIVNLELPLCLFALWFLLIAQERRSMWYWFSAGLLLGFGVATRPPLLLFVLLAIAWAAWSAGSRAVALRAAVLVAVGAASVVTPITLRNYAVSGRFVLVSTNGGINFYIGNNPDFDRTVTAQPGYEWQRIDRESIWVGNVSNPVAASVWYTRRALAFMRQQPTAWLALLARKVGHFLSAYELSRNYSYVALKRESPVLRYNPVGWIGILPLAVVGIVRIVLHRRVSSGVVLLWLFLAAIFVVTVCFFVDSRYRLPVVPVLCLFAATGLLGMVEDWHVARRRRAVLTAGAVFLIGAGLWLDPGQARALENWPDAFYRARIAHSMAQQAANRGETEQAEDLRRRAEAGYRQALRRDARSVDAANNLASLLLSQGRFEEAAAICRQGLAIDGEYMELLANLGLAEYGAGRYAESVEALRRAAATMPQNANVRYYLARSLVAIAAWDEAQEQIQHAERLGIRPETWRRDAAFAPLLERAGIQTSSPEP